MDQQDKPYIHRSLDKLSQKDVIWSAASNLDAMAVKMMFAIGGCQSRNHSAEKIGAGSSFDHFKQLVDLIAQFDTYTETTTLVHGSFLRLNSVDRDVPQLKTLCLYPRQSAIFTYGATSRRAVRENLSITYQTWFQRNSGSQGDITLTYSTTLEDHLPPVAPQRPRTDRARCRKIFLSPLQCLF